MNKYQEFLKKLNESKKKFNIQSNVGKVKYLVNFHDGIKTHSDGSEFFDIKTFKSKSKLNSFTGDLIKQGYKNEK